MNHVTIYDTTLRDGAQMEGISLSLGDKLRILGILDDLGMGIIEGGWPGAIPKDTDFFRAAAEIPLKNARLAAFGSTCRAGMRAEDDPQVLALRDSRAPIVTLVAKSDPRHVEHALRTTLEENLRMVRDTVEFLSREAEVMVDLEHFFDGLAFDPGYGLAVAVASAEAGASAVIACDTNGGNLPGTITDRIQQLRGALDSDGHSGVVVGIHAHNDTGCAVANSLAAVEAGATQVQGTVNGYGERTGNANLLTCMANLQLKMGIPVIPEEKLQTLTAVSHRTAEIVNLRPFERDPYVGHSAFAHKAGLHASAIRVNPDLYQHLDPAVVGSGMRMLVSEMAGRASIELKASELGIDLSNHNSADLTGRVAQIVKDREAEGYTYDAADASFDILLRRAMGQLPSFWRVESWKVTTREITNAEDAVFSECEATVKLQAGGRHICTAEGNGPVNALDHALRDLLLEIYPQVGPIHLTNFKVRILDEDRGGTDALTRVLIDSEDADGSWTTVGIGANVIEASWEALLESYQYGLLRVGATPISV